MLLIMPMTYAVFIRCGALPRGLPPPPPPPHPSPERMGRTSGGPPCWARRLAFSTILAKRNFFGGRRARHRPTRSFEFLAQQQQNNNSNRKQQQQHSNTATAQQRNTQQRSGRSGRSGCSSSGNSNSNKDEMGMVNPQCLGTPQHTSK